MGADGTFVDVEAGRGVREALGVPVLSGDWSAGILASGSAAQACIKSVNKMKMDIHP